VSSSLYFQARRERARAEAQAAKAERATGFLQEMLENAVPHDYSQEVTLVEWLDQTAGKLDGALPDDPGTEADLHVRLANAYGNLDRDDAVLAQLEAARDAAHRAGDPVQESGILAMLGQFDQILGKLAEAAAAWRGAVDLRTAALGPEDKTTLEANASLVVALMDQGIYPEAEERARFTLDARRRLLGEDDRSTLESALQVAALRMLQGDVAGCEERSRQVLDTCRNKLGPDEALTRNAMSQLAAAYLAQGKVDDAAAIYGHRRIPDNLGIEYAFQGPPGVDHKGTQLLVFWETWCPFSQRALPRLETMVQEHPEDIDVVGITSVWGSATDDKVRRFIADKGITYPILKIDHTAARALGQIGTPWGILAENGEVVWQDLLDTPNVFSGVMLEGLLAHLDE